MVKKKTEPNVFLIALLFLYISEPFFDIMTLNSCHTSCNSRHSSTMPWTAKEKAFCVKWYFATNSYNSVRKQFQNEYKKRISPSKSRIHAWTTKFVEHGSIENLNSKVSSGVTYSGRHPSARTPQNIDAVTASVLADPKKSTRRRSQELGLKRTSLMNILHKDLHLHAYHIQICHQLTPADMAKRTAMCEWFEEQLGADDDFLNNVWFSDEAHFLLSGHVNSQNNVYWGSEKHDEVLQRPLHSEKCTVWAALSRHGIIGPFFFEDHQGKTTTVDTESYRDVLVKFWNALGRRDLNREEQWLQQDGATPHTSNSSLAWLLNKFGERLISRRCDVEWAPHSPDLNPLDFFLWGYLKDRVYVNSPRTIPELKKEIANKIRAISHVQVNNVMDCFVKRIRACHQRGGAHIEHIL